MTLDEKLTARRWYSKGKRFNCVIAIVRSNQKLNRDQDRRLLFPKIRLLMDDAHVIQNLLEPSLDTQQETIIPLPKIFFPQSPLFRGIHLLLNELVMMMLRFHSSKDHDWTGVLPHGGVEQPRIKVLSFQNQFDWEMDWSRS
jgi:hypothetical protein